MADIDRLIRSALIALFTLAFVGANADDYSDGWGPAIGTPMPALNAPDHRLGFNVSERTVSKQSMQ